MALGDFTLTLWEQVTFVRPTNRKTMKDHTSINFSDNMVTTNYIYINYIQNYLKTLMLNVLYRPNLQDPSNHQI